MPKLMVSEYSEDIFEYIGELKVGPSSLHVAYSWCILGIHHTIGVLCGSPEQDNLANAPGSC